MMVVQDTYNNMEAPAEGTSQLLDLPAHVLLLLLSHLDVQSLCIASRTCTLLSKMCAHPSLWPHFKDDTWAMWDVRCTLARVLRVPPQVFNVQLDVKRSRRFPVTVPLHNLRPILHITDTEGLADRVSKAVQDQVSKLSASLWRFTSWQQLPPAASISICRADRSTVRASLRPGAVVPRLVYQLQQIGWPPAEAATTTPANHSIPATAAAVGGCAADSAVPGQQQPVGLATWPELEMHGASSSLDSVSAATMMTQCLQVCHARCEMLASGQLQQLAGLAGVMLRAASPSSGCEPRERLALRRSPAAQVAAAAADKLPDLATVRQFAVGHLSGLGVGQQAAQQHLAGAAARLMYLSAAADPSSVSFSLPGKPGWVLMLQQACKVLARLHTLQLVCRCGHQPLQLGDAACAGDGGGGGTSGGDMDGSTTRAARQLPVPPSSHATLLSACSPALEAAWPAATAAELQLCLAGLQEFPRAVNVMRCSPGSVLQCLHTLEAAASEYASDWGQLCSSEAVLEATKRMGALTLQAVLGGVEQQEAQIMGQVLQLPLAKLGEQHSMGYSGTSSTAAAGGDKSGTALPSQQMLVRCAMHVETLRTLSWCLWLLGAAN